MAPNDRTRQPPRQPPEPGKWKSFGLALLMHVLLVLALVFSLNWNRHSPGPVQAELWTALPSPNEPEPTPRPTPQPEPEPPKPAPPPPPPPEPKAAPQENPDIAIEQERKRREAERQAAAEREAERKKAEQRKLEEQKLAQQREQEKKDAEKKEADRKKAEQLAAEKKAAEKKAAADKAAADKAAAEKAAADKKAAAAQAERDRKLREAFRNDTARAAGLEGGREGGTANRNQAGGGGGDPGYANLVRACIKPGVIYSATGSSADGNPTAVFRVQLLPTGAQAGAPRLVRSSGVPAFDRAVETGIRRCDPFPRPASGRYDSTIDVQYRMFD